MNPEAIKFIEAMAVAVGVQRDPAIEGLIDAWVETISQAQDPDGYLDVRFPPGVPHPVQRWRSVWWSHQSYTTGHYIQAAIAYLEATGNRVMYDSAVRAADNMVADVLKAKRAYCPGHPEIEQALMELYGITGDTNYVQLCRWLLDQRGHHENRPSFGVMYQDHIPVVDQRAIEGHAVRAAYLFNGATHYVGATGDAGYRNAILSVWDDLVTRKLYLHGAGGNTSSRNEGYRSEDYCIPPDDTFGESCSVFANIQWAHSLFRLTGEARFVDTAERMLYNAFYASLSLQGDTTFYCNVSQIDKATPRTQELSTNCCPPNIVKLFNKVSGLFYSTDADGIYINHFGASEADIAWREGVKLIQHTGYPWDGDITIVVEPDSPQAFTLRLRVPEWASSHSLAVNGKPLEAVVSQGWLLVRRKWRRGDNVRLTLPMDVRRVTMPPSFKEYRDRVAFQRGPIVYCLEQLDVVDESGTLGNSRFTGLATIYVPEDAKFAIEYQPELLGGVVALRGEVRQLMWPDDSERTLRATLVPYGVWDNRVPGQMRIWLGGRRTTALEMLFPEWAHGETCVG